MARLPHFEPTFKTAFLATSFDFRLNQEVPSDRFILRGLPHLFGSTFPCATFAAILVVDEQGS
jgi:hypothetical protein